MIPNFDPIQDPCEQCLCTVYRLQFASQIRPLILLEQHLRVGIRVEDNAVQRIHLTCPVEHILVDIAIVSAQ